MFLLYFLIKISWVCKLKTLILGAFKGNDAHKLIY